MNVSGFPASCVAAVTLAAAASFAYAQDTFANPQAPSSTPSQTMQGDVTSPSARHNESNADNWNSGTAIGGAARGTDTRAPMRSGAADSNSSGTVTAPVTRMARDDRN